MRVSKDNWDKREDLVEVDPQIIAYWRKVNSVHRWFINKLADGEDRNCDPLKATKDDLQEIVEICSEILKDHSKAKELLPTSGGFFFGGTEYDEDYFQELEDTIRQISEVIEGTDWGNQVVYYYAWW